MTDEQLIAEILARARADELAAVLRFLREMAEEARAKHEELCQFRTHGNSEEARWSRVWLNVGGRLLDAAAALKQGAHRSPGAAP